MNTDPLEGITTFVAVVNAASFTGAARALGRSKAAVSTQIQRLEDRLGVRLLHRTTRRLALTEEGRVFHDNCRRILEEAREAEDQLTQTSTDPRGRLRVTAPVSFGVGHLSPAVSAFMKAYPGIEIDLSLNDRTVDLIEDGFDVAVRISAMADSSMIARRLAPCRRILVASEDYLAAAGMPATPHDLTRHQCLVYEYLAAPNLWPFKDETGPFEVRVDGRFRANNGDALLQAAIDGLGIYMTPSFFCCEAIRGGKLVTILDAYEAAPLSVHALYPHRRHLSAKVRGFVDFMADWFGPEPYWDKLT